MGGRLANKVAVVTGAGQGIGLAISERFLTEDATVIGIDKNENILNVFGSARDKFFPHVIDVEDHQKLTSCVETVIATFGSIQVLVNNAGFSYYEDVLSTTLDQWRHTQRVNVESQFLLCKMIAPAMVTAGYGRIVNISSTQAIAVEPQVSAYAASKAAINGFTRSLAVELAPYNIVVNAIAPGCIHTPMCVIDGVDQTESDTFQEWYVKERKIPLGRPGDAEEIASAAVFLASEECSYITGHVLVVDGGLTITF